MINTASRPGRLLAGVGFFVLVGLSSLPATAADYNYLDAAWVKLDPELGEASTGFRLRASAPIDQGQFMRASYGRIKSDTGQRTSFTRVGLGIASTYSAGSDVYFVLSYEELDHKQAAGDKGYSAELGLSFSEQQRWQLDIGARFLSLDQGGDGLLWRAEGHYRLTSTLAISTTYQYSDTSGEQLEAGLRFFSY